MPGGTWRPVRLQLRHDAKVCSSRTWGWHFRSFQCERDAPCRLAHAIAPAHAMQACWRNAYLDGVYIDTLQLDPLLYDLPKSGVLRLDFVSYDVPCIRHADLLCRLQTLRRSLFRVKPPSAMLAAASPPPSSGASVPRQSAAGPSMLQSGASRPPRPADTGADEAQSAPAIVTFTSAAAEPASGAAVRSGVAGGGQAVSGTRSSARTGAGTERGH